MKRISVNFTRKQATRNHLHSRPYPALPPNLGTVMSRYSRTLHDEAGGETVKRVPKERSTGDESELGRGIASTKPSGATV